MCKRLLRIFISFSVLFQVSCKIEYTNKYEEHGPTEMQIKLKDNIEQKLKVCVSMTSAKEELLNTKPNLCNTAVEDIIPKYCGFAQFYFSSTFGGVKPTLNMPELGIRLFLKDDGHVERIRLDYPFQGKVDGISLGENLDVVLERKGKDNRFMSGGLTDSYMYSPSSPNFVRFEVNKTTKKVDSILFCGD